MNIRLITALALVLAAVTGAAEDQAAPAPQIARVTVQNSSGRLARTDTEMIEAAARVVSVGRNTRRIVLHGPEGGELSLAVGPEVSRFNEIQPGDMVLVRYYSSLAFEVRKPTADELVRPSKEVSVADRNESDLPPGAGAAKVMHTIVTIQGIDRSRGTVTVRTPEGEVQVVKARDARNLERVQMGDTVSVTYSEAVAIAVEPMQGASIKP